MAPGTKAPGAQARCTQSYMIHGRNVGDILMRWKTEFEVLRNFIWNRMCLLAVLISIGEGLI